MDHTDDEPTCCRRCGAVNSTDKTVCGLCGEPLKEPVSSPEPVETRLSHPLAPNENHVMAPKSLSKTPRSALSILLRIFLILMGARRHIRAKPPRRLSLLLRIFLILLGLCVVVPSIFISFYATCGVVGGDVYGHDRGLADSFPVGALAGLVAAGFVGFIEFHTFKIFNRIFSTPRNDR